MITLHMPSDGVVLLQWPFTKAIHETDKFGGTSEDSLIDTSLLAWVGKQPLLFLMTVAFAGPQQLSLSREASGFIPSRALFQPLQRLLSTCGRDQLTVLQRQATLRTP